MRARRHRLAQRRSAVGFSQESLAERLGVDRSTVVRWETGDTTPLPWLRPKLASLLQVSIDRLDDLLTGADPAHGTPDSAPGRSSGAPRMASADSSESYDRDVCPSDPDVSAMQAFRAADARVGGGHLYATVVRYLRTDVAPRLFGMHRGQNNPALFSAAAGLTEMAGWMAHDAGHHEAAESHFESALSLASVGGDRQVTAHVLASASHLALHRRQPRTAMHLAERGQSALAAGPVVPELESRLLAMRARSFAALDQSAESLDQLRRAETALGTTQDEQRSPWVSCFDEGSLASETARCMGQLGDCDEAARQAERVIQLRPVERARSRALAQLMLIAAHLDRGRPEEACGLAREVLIATRTLGSQLIFEQLAALRQRFGHYRAEPAVAELLAGIASALANRVRFDRLVEMETTTSVPGGSRDL